MSEFNELVKHFNKVRSYVRDFYVYGFKTRTDYQQKSGRTYDNERRRIESWFSGYIRYDYNLAHEKAVAITVDSNRISVNPLYNVWKTRSFTANDIMLHFFLVDLMQDGGFKNLDTITDELLECYQVLFDAQTIRKKLTEYAAMGIIQIKKEGKQHFYGLTPDHTRRYIKLLPGLAEAVCFFQAAAPFGFIGSTLLDCYRYHNKNFRFRHDYLVHTLEDEILLPILTAIRQKQILLLEIRSSRHGRVQTLSGTPLKILVSTQTGRRYVCVRRPDTQRLATYRLDGIQKAQPAGSDPDFAGHLAAFEKNYRYTWGVSFGSHREPEQVRLIIALDEASEGYIITRIEREGRNGTLTRLMPDRYEYCVECWDSTELIPWVKSFTGRIILFTCSNKRVECRFWQDMQLLQDMYL